MRLLVSVRSAAEAQAALTGGADIVDAKEPSRGSLGPVTAATLRDIAAAVPLTIPLSVALGDFDREETVAAAVAAVVTVRDRPGPVYYKLGFAGAATVSADRILRSALDAARARVDRPLIVAAAYADHEEVGAPAPDVVMLAAARLGAAGVLLDTGTKDGRDLLHWMPPARLRTWIGEAGGAGLLTAVAGSLYGGALDLAAGCGADVVGVRGAVCAGGRTGVLEAELVRAVKQTLTAAGDRSLEAV
jgi:(5-formylfuran-3-yl)methyl phosphate synthase